MRRVRIRSIRTILGAEKVAQGVGLPIERVFKTLVAKGDKHGILLAVVPGDAEVDLKALARLSDNKRVEMVHLSEVQPLTGYIRGGVTALACKKDYPVYADISMEQFDSIAVSAGMRGLQIILSPQGLYPSGKSDSRPNHQTKIT